MMAERCASPGWVMIMFDVFQRPTSWPDPDQEHLLQSALLPDSRAVEAWRRWKRQIDFQEVDYGSQRLLPLVYRNLHKKGVDDPDLERYKGTYQRSWVSNQLLLHRVMTGLEEIQTSGMEVLFFKGAALVASCSINAGLRPMDDLDILVRPENARRVIDHLITKGWQPKHPHQKKFNPDGYSVMLHDGEFHYVDIHWKTLNRPRAERVLARIWDEVVEADFQGRNMKVMGAADQLYHTCLHGIAWNPIPSIRWVADAVLILRNEKSAVNWDVFLEQAAALRANYELSRCLDYLQTKFSLDIPDRVTNELNCQENICINRAYFQVVITKPIPVVGGFLKRVFLYWKFFRGEYRFPGFLRYLQEEWRLDHLGQVPFSWLRRFFRKMHTDLFQEQ